MHVWGREWGCGGGLLDFGRLIMKVDFQEERQASQGEGGANLNKFHVGLILSGQMFKATAHRGRNLNS